MRYVHIIGFGLMGLLGVGLSLSVIDAWRDGRWFNGVNYKGLAMGTYSTGLVILMIVAIGAVWLGQRFVRTVRRHFAAQSEVSERARPDS